MKLRSWYLSLVVLFLAIVPALVHGQTTPLVGQKAPDFTLSSPDGQATSLASLNRKGPVVLVMLRGFPGYQCPYCTKQVHDFVDNASKFAQARIEVLLIYPGPPADLDQRAKEFLAKQAALPENIHLVIDPDYKVTNLYALRWDAPRETAYPSTFVLDRKGIVRFEKVSKVHGDRTTAADVLAELEKAKE